MDTREKIAWIMYFVFLVGTIIFGCLYFFNPQIKEDEKQQTNEDTYTYTDVQYNEGIKLAGQKAVEDYIATQAEKALKLKTEQEEKEKKEGVLRIDEKSHIVPQGLYELSGWIFTPAGRHIAHGNSIYVQFNYLSTDIMSPCGATLKPIGAVASNVKVIQIGIKPTETKVAKADDPPPITPPKPTPPKPTPPKPQPKPQPKPPTPPSKPCGEPVDIKKDKEWISVAGYIISGDIEYFNTSTGKWIRLYDTGFDYPEGHDRSAKTALLVVIKTSGIRIRAPYGASGACDVSQETFKKQKIAEGFEEVIVKSL